MLAFKTTKIFLNILKSVFLLFLLIDANASIAQQPNFELDSYSALSGITSSKTTAIVQDSTGYLWIGTEEGLFRFDGQTVYPYYFIISDQHALPSNGINKLVLDAKNNLWIGTTAGLCTYNREYDNFSRIPDKSEVNGFETFNVRNIEFDRSGQLYVEYENVIYKYDAAEKQFSVLLKIEKGSISDILFDLKDNLWIASSEGLFCFDYQTKQLNSFLHDPKNKQSISSNEIAKLALAGETLWIGTSGNGIYTYNLKTKTFFHYSFTKNLENYINSIYVSPENKIWVCTFSCLKLFNPADNNFWNYYNDPENRHSVVKSLQGFYEDRDGNYWTIHSIGGVRLARRNIKFNHIEGNAGVTWTTSEKIITALCYDGDNRLWIGNYYNGFDIFDWGKQQTTRMKHHPNQKKSLAEGTVFTIFCDSRKQMWVGNYLGGLQKYNPKTNDFNSYRHDPMNPFSIAGNDIRSITEDTNGDLWLAIQGEGVDRFDIRKQTFRHYNTKNSQLFNKFTFQVLVDSQDNLWVATAWGLSFLEKGKQIFKNFLYNKKDTTSISNNEIHSIYEDPLHRLWVGTNDGLNRFNYENETFSHYSSGLKNNHISAILSDRENNIWVSTNAGISMLNPNTHRFTNYDQNYGLLSKEFMDRACLKDNEGTLFFGGTLGFDTFNPDSLKPETRKPKVVLTDFRLFNKSISYLTDSLVIDRSIGAAKQIHLNHSQNSVTIIFQAIDLVDAKNIVYKYQLDGFDKDWIFSDKKREANYTNLNPGNYTFRVKAKFENGNWNSAETILKIEVTPAWWMTIWFKIFLGIFLLSAPVFIVYTRIKRLNRQKEKLGHLVAERTQEIIHKNELLESQAKTLEKQNEQLKELNSTKNKLFSLISHDLRSPFHTILGFQSLLVSKYTDFSNSERRSMINKMYSKTNQVYNLVENLLNWSGIQTSGIQINPDQFCLKDLVLKKFEIYRIIAEEKGVSIKHQIPDELFVFADPSLLETVLRNLINNAVKFTASGGSILITAAQHDQEITVSVKDSGVGMTQEQIDSLSVFDQTQSKRGTDGEKGSGLGLMLCSVSKKTNY